MIRVFCPSCGRPVILPSLEARDRERCGRCASPLTGASTEAPAAQANASAQGASRGAPPAKAALSDSQAMEVLQALRPQPKRPSLMQSHAGWASVRDGLLGLRAALGFALVFGTVLGLLMLVLPIAAIRREWYANSSEVILTVVALMAAVVVAGLISLALVVYVLKQLSRLTRAPEGMLSRWAWLALVASLLQVLTIPASFLVGEKLLALTAVLGLAGTVGLALFLVRLDKRVGAEAFPLVGMVLAFAPGLLLQAVSAARTLFVSVWMKLFVWGNARPWLESTVNVACFLLSLLGILLLRASLARLSEALEQPQP